MKHHQKGHIMPKANNLVQKAGHINVFDLFADCRDAMEYFTIDRQGELVPVDDALGDMQDVVSDECEDDDLVAQCMIVISRINSLPTRHNVFVRT
jgi:hypothetical protein